MDEARAAGAQYAGWRAALAITIAGLLAAHQVRSGTTVIGIAYGAPIAALLVWHFTERLVTRPRLLLGAVDVLAIGIALGRLLPEPPTFYSGHAVYAAYLLAGPVSRSTRALAAAVSVQVAVFKLVLFRDPRTLAGGIVVGVVLALIGWATGGVRRAK